MARVGLPVQVPMSGRIVMTARMIKRTSFVAFVCALLLGAGMAIADRLRPRVVFQDPRTVDQPGLARVAGARVNLVEADHQPLEALARISSNTTMTIATA